MASQPFPLNIPQKFILVCHFPSFLSCFYSSKSHFSSYSRIKFEAFCHYRTHRLTSTKYVILGLRQNLLILVKKQQLVHFKSTKVITLDCDLMQDPPPTQSTKRIKQYTQQPAQHLFPWCVSTIKSSSYPNNWIQLIPFIDNQSTEQTQCHVHSTRFQKLLNRTE